MHIFGFVIVIITYYIIILPYKFICDSRFLYWHPKKSSVQVSTNQRSEIRRAAENPNVREVPRIPRIAQFWRDIMACGFSGRLSAICVLVLYGSWGALLRDRDFTICDLIMIAL